MNIKKLEDNKITIIIEDWIKLSMLEKNIICKNKRRKGMEETSAILKSLILMIALSGCVTTPQNISVSEGMRPTLVNYNPPEWVLKGPGTFKDSDGTIIWGVSSVSGVKNTSLQRIAADNRARNAVAKVFQVHSKSLTKDMLAHAMTGNLESTSEEQGIETGIKTGAEQILHGVMIVDHWEHPGRNELFSLARLDLNQFDNVSSKTIKTTVNNPNKFNTNKDNEENLNSFPEEIKESIKNSSNKFFQQLD